MALFGGRSDDDRDDDERGPWGSRGFVASVIVMIAVVICGLSLLFLGGSDDPESAPSPSPTPTSGQPTETGPTEEPTSSAEPTENPTPVDPTPVDPTPPSRPGPCKIPPGDQRIMSTAPVSVIWKFEAGLLVPTKSTIGPGARDANGVASCFARSPIGAVFAAMNTLAQIRDESIAVPVLEKRMAPGPGRTRAVNQARSAQRNATPGRAAAEVQFVGFKVIDYTPTRTVVSLAVQTDIEHIGGMAVTLRWVDGDWRVALRSDGSISGDPDVLSALDGYVRFRGA